MADKNFKVKNGLVVGQDIDVNGTIKINGTTVIDSTGSYSGKYLGVDSDIAVYLTTNSYSTQAYVDSAINGLIDAAPDQLNTLNELSQALNNDSDFAGTITQLIGTKANAEDVASQIDSATVGILNTVSDLIDSSAATTLATTIGLIDSSASETLTTVIDLIDSSASETLETTKQLDGTTTAIASGTLGNGDIVVLNIDGTVSIISSTTTDGTTVPAASANFNADRANECAVAFDPNNANKFVITFQDKANSYYGTAIVGTINGTTISFGSKYVFASGTVSGTEISFDRNTAGNFVVVYKNWSNSSYGTAVVGNVSGTTITFGTPVVFNANATNETNIDVAFDYNTANKFVVIFRDETSGYGTAKVGTVSGTTVSFGSSSTFNTTQNNYPCIASDINRAGKFIISYYELRGVSGAGSIVIGTVNGTSISFGTEFDLNTGSVGISSISFDPAANNKFIVVFRDNTSSGSGVARIGTTDGTNIILGSKYEFTSNSITDPIVVFSTNSRIIISYKDISDNNYGKVVAGTVNETSILFGNINTSETSTFYMSHMAIDPNAPDNFIIVYSDNNALGKTILGTLGDITTTTNLTETNFIGFSKDSYSDGELAIIRLSGSITDGHSGLNIGDLYYADGDGNLITSPSIPSVYVGIAIDSDKLEIGAPASLKLITNTIDSAYIQARQLTNLSDFTNDANYIATDDSAQLSALSVNGNIIVGGNLQVNGTTVTVNSTSMEITDNMVYMNAGESDGSPTASIDIGFAANVNDRGSYEHVGFFRDATDNTFKVFQGYSPEPDASVQINTAHATFDLAPFAAKTLTGSYLGFDSDVTAAGLATETYVTTTIDSAYINARVVIPEVPVDSGVVFTLIDSAYINDRVVIPDAGVDSAAVASIAAETIDSAYINARISTYAIDSAAIISLIDSNYTNMGIGYISGLNKFYYTATAGQLVFTGADNTGKILNYIPGSIQAFLNGINLLDGIDYTATDGTTFNLVDSAELGSELIINGFNTRTEAIDIGVALTTSYIDFSEYLFIADSGQTVFSGTDNNGNTLAFDSNNYNIFVNGIKLISSDYSANSSTNVITLNDPALLSDEVIITVSNKQVVTGSYTVDSNSRVQIANIFNNAFDSAYTLATASVNTLISNAVDSYYGIAVNQAFDSALPIAISTINTSVDSAINVANPVIQAFIDSSFNALFDYGAERSVTKFLFTADSAQSVFTGIDDNGNTLAFADSSVIVSANGIVLLEGTDYNATNNTVTLTYPAPSGLELYVNVITTKLDFDLTSLLDSALIANIVDSNYINSKVVIPDVPVDSAVVYTLIDSAYINDRVVIPDVPVDSDVVFALIDSAYINDRVVIPGLSSWIAKTANYTIATGGEKIIADTTGGAITLTLPATATLGDEIRIIDGGGAAATNNITIAANGHNIQADSGDLVVDINRAAFGLVYYNTTNGWLFSEK